MMALQPLVVLAIVAVSLSSVLAESSRLSWTPEDMYNPITEPRSCGLSTDEPGYICDPNGILGEEINKFQVILQEVANNGTRCPCSTYHCEHYKGFKGYRVGIALVNKMELQKSMTNEENSPEAQAQIFAYHLENTKWKMGKCEEDIIIFYSLDDRVLAIYGGSTALAKLTPYYRELLAFKANNYFQNGDISGALHSLISDLKILLNCESKENDCGIHEIIIRPQDRNGNSAGGRQDMLSHGLVVLLTSLVAVYKLWY